MEQQLAYQIYINGVPYGNKQPSRFLAESILQKLLPEQRAIAEIRPITSDGKEILFG